MLPNAANIKVRYIENDQPKEARAFQVTRTKAYEDEPRQYRSFQVLSGDSAFAAQMMETALDDLVRWRTRYAPYTEMWARFGDVFQIVINQVSEFKDEVAANETAFVTDEALARLIAWRDEFSEALATWTHVREEVGYIMEAIDDAEASFARLKEKSTHKCIKCGEQFLALEGGYRTCPKCRQSLEYKSGSGLEIANVGGL